MRQNFVKKWCCLKNIFKVSIFIPCHYNIVYCNIRIDFSFFRKNTIFPYLADIHLHQIEAILDKSMCFIEKIKLES